jgi:uncharacterized caspase-like protein
MRIVGLAVGVFCCVLGLLAGPAEARRVALVIGNADYKVGALENPVHDAAAVAKAFEALGFDKVALKENLGADDFRAALMEMSHESTGAELGVVYFAGHGVEVAGHNYLVPTDAVLARQGDVDLQAIALDTVVGQLAGVEGLKLVILDACRTNLFPLAGTTRAIGRGLSSIEPENGTLVVYAAKDGTTADDGTGRGHSPFTEALLRHIATPNLEVRLLFGRVRDDVLELTRHEAEPQQPYLYGALGGRLHYLAPVAAGGESAEAQRLIEQERELAKAVADAKAAEEQSREAQQRLDAQSKAQAKAADEAKRKQALAAPLAVAPAPGSGSSGGAGTSCSQYRAKCMDNCNTGLGKKRNRLMGGFTSCDGMCGVRFSECIQTGIWVGKYGQRPVMNRR